MKLLLTLTAALQQGALGKWPKVSDFVACCASQKPTAMQESHADHMRFLHGLGFFDTHKMLQNLIPLATV